MNDQDDMHRRRQTDMPGTSTELILYQISELKAAVKEGFAEMRAAMDGHEKRIASLERKDERRTERETLAAKSADRVDSRWIPVTVAIMGFGGLVFTAIQAFGH